MKDTFHATRQELANLAEDNFTDKETSVHNLLRKDHLALKSFTKDCSLVFKHGDKTSYIVVKNINDYQRRNVTNSDTKTYQRLDRDHTPDLFRHVTYTLEQYRRG